MSFFSQIFFSEAQKLIKLSKTQVIDSTHQIDLPSHLGAYRNNWNESVINWSTGKTLYKSTIKSSGSLFFKIIILQLCASLFSFSTPVLINKFITDLQLLNSGVMAWNQANIIMMVMLGVGLGLCGAGHGVIIQHYFYKTLNFFQTATNIVNKKIYIHSLKISNATKQKNQIGEIVNLMSSDADAIGDIAITTVDLSNAVLLLVGCSAMLFYYIGWSAGVAIVVMAVLVPLTQSLAKKFMHLEEALMKHRDRRMTVMAQILNAVRVVKYFSWEKSVINEVAGLRTDEINARIKLNKAEILWGLIYTSISTIVLFTALLTHYLRGFEINLAVVLTCISIFSLMEDQFGGLSRFIGRFINIFVSGNRITAFLKSESVEAFQSSLVPSSDRAIHFSHVYFGYTEDKPILANMSFQILQGQSIAVVGGVGSGKTTLLQSMLNEMSLTSGKISIPSDWKVAYQSQEPFILNATLKENIIFGSESCTEENINQAVRLASLNSDISLFPNGLTTEIGEKGVNLSGGQKQRVCIARCILAEPELILMDDPLSAVDVHTEAELCENLIFGAWKNKTRVVTTHRISHLKRFDKILFLSSGKYILGTYDELMISTPEFKNYIDIEIQNQKSEKEIILSKIEQNSRQVLSDNSRITVDEDRAIGSVESTVYKSYVLSLGGEGKKARWIVGAIFLSAILAILAPLAQKTWITKYNGQFDTQTLIYGYGLLGVLTMVIFYFNSLFWLWRGISAGQRFHNKALRSLLNTEIRFFDSTPVGRILQRFSRDVESVDVHIQWTFEQTMNSLLQVGLSFLLIVGTLPLTIVFLVPILIYYYMIQNAYRRVAREAKRLDSLARSPRYAHFKETLQGLSVIRAFKKQNYFDQEFLVKLQKSNQAYYTHIMINRWFSTRLPLIGALISSVTVLAIVFSSYKHWMNAGLAGLITIYALQFWRYLNWGIRIFSDLESRMTSVERLSFYSELAPEKEYVPESNKVLPQSGHLTFKNVKLKYAEHLPYVLNDVSFDIKSGEKVGIVGRTGSGKSTLFQAVYRFVNYDQGDILLDGKSIRDYTLPNLRKSLAVIPQDPSLFMGTLRSNLDRDSEKTDDEVLAILKQVGLFDFVRSLPDQLGYMVTENGSNLSQGQRQLVCLARALLMKVKIIFLDEATASVDVETDAVIQKVIRTSLDGITLVTIAHRLSTLKDYDKIIELDSGRIVLGQ